MPKERIVSVGFLSARDLQVLGEGFVRHFPVGHDDMFAELIEQLDRIEAEPLGKGVLIRPSRREP